ncbi:hypothetical protein PROFUN_07917 [Planoprotostelium fungivorum]|uniref:Uncharacterized protein n=1 Tax=Planoprotostelium fungivorum TaxID=1890364 RepID=A0A2P6NL26_9EUKA|nr:hypothetical protein PROFUN_07917 [Planoprotostelium fungivorum]
MEKFWWHLGKSSNHYCSRACEVFIDAIQESSGTKGINPWTE